MCGIAGILDLDGAPVAPEDVRALCAALEHRGPDDEGLYVGPGIGLGARRLSIVDPAGGRQPVRSEDGDAVAALNGEIYNHVELRRELVARGHRYASACDTEALVHLYEER